MLTIALLAAAAAASPQPTTAEVFAKTGPQACFRRQFFQASDRVVLKGEAPRPAALGQQPPARLELAVSRTVEGCPVPVIVRQDVERTPPSTRR